MTRMRLLRRGPRRNIADWRVSGGYCRLGLMKRLAMLFGLFFIVFPAHAAERIVPNDTLYPKQWSLHQINAEEAWAVTQGSPKVTVAVIDAGVDITHPDLVPNIWTNPYEIPGDGIDNDQDGYVDDIHGWNFVTNASSVQPVVAVKQQDDAWSHGTIVSSILGARGNDGFGMAGVAWNVKIMPLVVLDGDGYGNVPNIIQAVRFAIAHGAKVINLSLTGYEQDNSLDAIMDEAAEADIVVVAAAGNDEDKNGEDLALLPVYPACSGSTSATVIAVTGTDVLDQRAPFADFGSSCTDIAAPGHELIAAHPLKNAPDWPVTSTNMFVSGVTGTSAASPLVAGTAALIRSVRPDWSAVQVRQRILETSDSVETGVVGGASGRLGYGRLNVGHALAGLGTVKPALSSKGVLIPKIPVWMNEFATLFKKL